MSKANGHARRRKCLSLPLIAAVIALLLATTTFAVTTTGYRMTGYRIGNTSVYTTVIAIDENGQIIYPEPDIGVTLSISDVTPTGCQVTYALEGMNDLGLMTNDNTSYFLEVLTETGWDILSTPDDYKQPDCIYYLCETKHSFYLDWSDRYRELSPGTYRIVKDFGIPSKQHPSEWYDLTAEFVIGG